MSGKYKIIDKEEHSIKTYEKKLYPTEKNYLNNIFDECWFSYILEVIIRSSNNFLFIKCIYIYTFFVCK